MFWLRQNPYGNHENLLLKQENSAVREELLAYKKAGGGAMVENTTTGIDRDLPTIRQMSKETGVHVIGGAGYYVDANHTEATKRMTVEEV
jgi:phosphotriesterase-related protein